jgi:hypothetical protein
VLADAPDHETQEYGKPLAKHTEDALPRVRVLRRALGSRGGGNLVVIHSLLFTDVSLSNPWRIAYAYHLLLVLVLVLVLAMIT